MSGIRSITRRPTVVGFATAGSAPIYVDSDDNRLKSIPAGTGTTEVIYQEAGGASMTETLITTRVLTAADSGKTFVLSLATGFTVTLPALAAGLKFKFVVGIAPTTRYVIASAEGDNISLVGAAADGNAVVVNSAGFTADQVNLVANLALIGDVVIVDSVSTLGWAAQALVGVGAGVTIEG
jgi:hypothetical protein